MLPGYETFIANAADLIVILSHVVEGSTNSGLAIILGYQPLQLPTYRQQRGLTLQVGWEDKVDIGIQLFEEGVIQPAIEWRNLHNPIPLSPIASEVLEEEYEVDVCRSTVIFE